MPFSAELGLCWLLVTWMKSQVSWESPGEEEGEASLAWGGRCENPANIIITFIKIHTSLQFSFPITKNGKLFLMSDWQPGLGLGSVHQQRGDGDKKPRGDQGAGGAGQTTPESQWDFLMREKRETQEASGQTSEEIESEIICTAKIHDM